MKKLFISAALIAASFAANAQYKVGVFGGLLKPMADISEANNGLGGGISIRKGINEKLFFGANIGYYKFSTDESDVSLSIIPLVGVVEYYFTEEGFKPFVGGEIGWGLGSLSYSGGSDAQKGAYIAPMAGVAYALNDQFEVSANLKYALFQPNGTNTISGNSESANWSHLGINVGLSFIIPE